MERLVSVLSVAIIVLAACAPGATGSVDTEAILAALAAPCVNDPPPVVAVIEFENTTSRFGTTVTGAEAAATARLITLLKESECYMVVEQSVLQDLTAGCIFLDQPPRIAPRGPTWGAIGSRRAFFRNAIVDCRLNHCETRCIGVFLHGGLPLGVRSLEPSEEHGKQDDAQQGGDGSVRYSWLLQRFSQ